MDITVLFEQVFGLYLILTGVLVLIKQEHIVSVGRMFGKDYALRFSMGALVALGGLFMVLSYRDWSTGPTIIITLVGWLVLMKGLALLFMSDRQINSIFGAFFKGHVYRVWGIAALVAGAYLTLLGFGVL